MLCLYPAFILSALLLWKNRTVLSAGWNFTVHGRQKPSSELNLKKEKIERDTQGVIECNYHVFVVLQQIADQVGELLIHCRYGCKMRHDNPGEFEVDPSGTCTCTTYSRQYSISFSPFLHLSLSLSVFLLSSYPSRVSHDP